MSAHFANRYVIGELLGRGGMCTVHRAVDQTTGNTVALKRMLVIPDQSAEQRAKLSTLFEHEYCTLAELSHPRLVAVYDYGTVEDAPYYTMELLDGQDLRELAPLPWREACSVLRDVCSALSLLHSRRLVHRDLTPRNVRRTSDGQAKLFDLGAMAAFGLARHIVGTPAYTAPETLRAQPLDGRTDLFALGAVSYWVLTARPAYPARTLGELETLWRRPLIPPSSYVPEIPEALDQLVMSLLALDPLARPSSAAEVMSRLTAIAELPQLGELEVAQAYLTTPKLVGRERYQADFRDRMAAASAGRGSAVIVAAPGGLGRSRLLGQYVLEAKLSGATVLHVHAAQLPERELGVLRALLEQLSTVQPEAFERPDPQSAALARFVREGRESERRSVAPPAQKPKGHDELPALVRTHAASFLIELARALPLTIVVDDVHRADSASIVVLVELSAAASSSSLVVATSADTEQPGTSPQALAALREQSAIVPLAPLEQAQTEQLLASVFGDIPNLEAVATYVHRVAQGNPRTCMEFAQHLVDRKIVRFSAGSWELPNDLGSLELPASIEQVLDSRIAALSCPARALAELLALATRFLPLDVSDYVRLLAPNHSSQQVFAAVDELVSANVLAPSEFGHRFEHAQLVAALQRGMAPAHRLGMHRRLADYYAKHHATWAFIAAHHMKESGDIGRACDHIVNSYFPSSDLNTPNIQLARAPEGVALIDALLDYISQRQLPKAALHKIRTVALKLGAVADPRLARGADETIAQLVRDSGRIYFDDTDPTLELPQRVKACFEKAQAAYLATPEHERGLAPLQAIQELAVSVSTLSAVCGRTRAAERAASLPSLIEPFRVFQAVQVVHDISSMVANSIARGEYVLEQRKRTLASLENPVPGIDEITRLAAQMIITYYAGLDEAVRCDAGALERAARLEQHPHYAALASQVRVVYHANTGNAHELERARKRRALLSMTTSETDHHLIVGVAYELPVLARTEDLMALRAVIPRLRADAQLYPGWVPVLHYAEAAQRALLGEPHKARRSYERGLALAEPGKHASWAPLVEGYIHVLLALREYDRALEVAQEVERVLRALGLQLFEPTHMAVALAMAEALAGRTAHARERIMAHIEHIETTPRRGLIRGALYETRARIALLEEDDAAYQQYLERTLQEYRPGRHPGLLARYERLRTAGRKLTPGSAEREAQDSIMMRLAGSETVSALQTRIATCASPEQRARAALLLALELSGAEVAFLYACEGEAVKLAAEVGATEDIGLDLLALRIRSLAVNAVRNDEEATRALETESNFSNGDSTIVHESKRGRRFFMFALSDPSSPLTLRGVLVLSEVNGQMPDVPAPFLSALCNALPDIATATPGSLSALAPSRQAQGD